MTPPRVGIGTSTDHARRQFPAQAREQRDEASKNLGNHPRAGATYLHTRNGRRVAPYLLAAWRCCTGLDDDIKTNQPPWEAAFTQVPRLDVRSKRNTAGKRKDPPAIRVFDTAVLEARGKFMSKSNQSSCLPTRDTRHTFPASCFGREKLKLATPSATDQAAQTQRHKPHLLFELEARFFAPLKRSASHDHSRPHLGEVKGRPLADA